MVCPDLGQTKGKVKPRMVENARMPSVPVVSRTKPVLRWHRVRTGFAQDFFSLPRARRKRLSFNGLRRIYAGR